MDWVRQYDSDIDSSSRVSTDGLALRCRPSGSSECIDVSGGSPGDVVWGEVQTLDKYSLGSSNLMGGGGGVEHQKGVSEHQKGVCGEEKGVCEDPFPIYMPGGFVKDLPYDTNGLHTVSVCIYIFKKKPPHHQ